MNSSSYFPIGNACYDHSTIQGFGEVINLPVGYKPKPLDSEDFSDVFGGPPRTVYSRQYSGDEFDRSDIFYEDIFRKPERDGSNRHGRNLPGFRIPSSVRNDAGGRRSEEFAGDYFRMDFDEVLRSRSKLKNNSKSNSSSVLSYEEFSPFRPPISDDDGYFPDYASNLRPFDVQSTWNTSTVMHDVQQRLQEKLDFPYSRPKQFDDNEQNENSKSTYFSFSRRVSSPESMSRGAYSYSSVKASVGDEENNMNNFQCEGDEEEDDDEIMSSYVIEIKSNYKEGTDEGLGVDEAIAWAKESFQSQSSPEEASTDMTERAAVPQFPDRRMDGCESLHLQGEYPNKLKTEKELRRMDESKEMELLEKDIKLWSSGKERNIELLLTTLDNILWPNSGWYPIHVTNLYKSSNVKKAYQKAQLCLHPDKLQQRGATLSQKYVAERIFLILQEAWAAYISQDIIISV